MSLIVSCGKNLNFKSCDKNESRFLDAEGGVTGERFEEKDRERESERESDRDSEIMIAFVITLGEIM